VQIDRYQILNEIARGGMGVVFRAHDPATGQDVAIKVLIHGALATPTTQKRFIREAQALAKVRHPNVVRVHACGVASGGEPFIAMELVDGESLDTRLERDGPMDPSEAVGVVSQLCSAVGACHRAGILHRDLKPDNVMVTERGVLKLTDFGLVRDLDPSMSRTQLTKTGVYLGSPGFWSPEQAGGKLAQIGVRTDVYGLGAVLFALLSGRPPNVGETLLEILASTREPKPKPSTFNPRVPAWLDRVVARTLATHPNDRLADPTELAEALAAGDVAITGIGSRALWVASILGVVLVVGALALWGRNTPIATPTGPPPGVAPPPTSEEDVVVATTTPKAVKPDPANVARWRRLAKSYATGDGAERNLTEAVFWYRKVANAGDSDAMFTLGAFYALGRGVTSDAAEAARWYRKAADLGNPDAMCTLGAYFANGKGVKQSYSEAVRWTQMAVDAAGHPAAMTNLGLFCQSGNGVKRDDAKACRWFRKAADAGNSDAMYFLALAYGAGAGVKQDDAEAARWYREASDAGSRDASFNLGAAYSAGRGVTQDYTEAARWYRKSADAGSAAAMNNLGILYNNGLGQVKDYALAARWYREGAEAGNSAAMVNLGILYAYGRGFAKDYAKAARWYRLAANAGDEQGMSKLGYLYEKGDGVEQDFAKAAHWYRLAVDKGYGTAIYNLGLLRFNGQGGPRDLEAASKLFQQRTDAYGALRVFLCALEQGPPAKAVAGLRLHSAEHPQEGWEATLIAYCSGDLSEVELLAEAAKGEDQEAQTNRRCQATFYAAAVNLADGKKAEAVALLRECLDTDATGFREYQGAGPMLTRITGIERTKVGYAEATRLYRSAAQFAAGEGTEQDYAQAARLYRRAANGGHAGAMNKLGWFYDQGNGVPKDYGRAAGWFRKAAKLGHSHAMFNLGVLYRHGRGVKKDEAEAARLFRLAVDAGYVAALPILGLLYELGQGVPQDYDEAVRLYRRATNAGDSSVKLNLGACYEYGRGVKQDLVEAARLYREAADGGDTQAMVKIGLLLDAGKGVAQDAVKAFGWYRKAAEAENTDALKRAGLSRFDGVGSPRDLTAAISYLQKSPSTYSALYAFLAAMEQGKREEALTALRLHRTKQAPKAWEATLTAFCLGELSEAQLLAEVPKGENEKRRDARRCEATFYAGAIQLVNGRTSEAKALLLECLDTSATTYIEYRSAKAMLKRIDRSARQQ
jgi:uncharacterized protein